MMNRFLLIPVFLLLFACSNQGEEWDIVTKGPRKMGIHVTEGSTADYDASFAIAKNLGMQVVPITFYWTTLENSEGFDTHLLKVANLYYPSQNISASLNISPVAATEKNMPSDIENLKFDDPEVIQRFKRLLDTIHFHLPDLQLNNLLIGNEIDLYLSSDANRWSEFTTFYNAAITHAKNLWGNQIPIGVESTWGTMVSDTEKVRILNQNSDFVAVTYYPLESDFTMKPPDAILTDMEQVFNLFPGRKIFLEETGYASSSVCNSSPEMQAAYVENVFRMWDKHVYDLIFVGFLWLHDLDESNVAYFTGEYGMSGSPNQEQFGEYLRTCGLLQNDGTAKPAYESLQIEANLRGW